MKSDSCKVFYFRAASCPHFNEVDEVKYCKVCGRRMEWRKAWEDCWDEVKTCSAKCRKRGLTAKDREVETELEKMLRVRGKNSSLCPSEVAREMFDDTQWRSEMETVRMAGRRLVAAGKAQFLQKNQVVDPSFAKGPIRIRLKN